MTRSHGLTRTQRRELEAELLAERSRLERSLARASETDASAEIGAFGARAPASADGGVALALETRKHARYGAILDALTRVAADSYGVCVSCHNRIPYDRLAVMPETARCLPCGSRA